MMLLLVWTKTIVPMFTRERITRPKNSTGTILGSLARPPFPNVNGAAVTRYATGATASTSKSAFAFLTILALSGNMDPRRVRIGLKRLAVDSRSLLVFVDGPVHLETAQMMKDEELRTILRKRGYRILELVYSSYSDKKRDELYREVLNGLGK